MTVHDIPFPTPEYVYIYIYTYIHTQVLARFAQVREHAEPVAFFDGHHFELQRCYTATRVAGSMVPAKISEKLELCPESPKRFSSFWDERNQIDQQTEVHNSCTVELICIKSVNNPFIFLLH